jgi:DNA mismatch repair protein MSH6
MLLLSLQELLAREIAAEEQKDKVLKNSNGKIFSKFSELYDKWSKATYNIAVLDCLMSLSEYARSCDTCVPTIFDDTENEKVRQLYCGILPSNRSVISLIPMQGLTALILKIFIEITDGKHPCIISDNFIPNDTSIAGPEAAPLMILTGPNMGGKSTVMRQVGLITIMAQIVRILFNVIYFLLMSSVLLEARLLPF